MGHAQTFADRRIRNFTVFYKYIHFEEADKGLRWQSRQIQDTKLTRFM